MDRGGLSEKTRLAGQAPSHGDRYARRAFTVEDAQYESSRITAHRSGGQEETAGRAAVKIRIHIDDDRPIRDFGQDRESVSGNVGGPGAIDINARIHNRRIVTLTRGAHSKLIRR
jgi:hypothetical protein